MHDRQPSAIGQLESLEPRCLLSGTPLLNVLGTPGDDVIRLQPGREDGQVVVDAPRLDGKQTFEGVQRIRIAGGAGDDVIEVDRGIVDVLGEAIAVTIIGGHGNDTIESGDGDDWISGGPGHDRIDAGRGDDFVHGGKGAGDDEIDGGDGNDLLRGGAGHDTLRGEDGDDVIEGHGGDDVIDGGPGDDYLLGHDGDDEIDGGRGHDTAHGGKGHDALDGEVVTNVVPRVAKSNGRVRGFGGHYNALQFGMGNSSKLTPMPDLNNQGMRPITVIYGALWPSGKPESQPDEAHIRQLARKLPTNQPVVLDIEHWSVVGSKREATIRKFEKIVEWIREENPGVTLGFYDLLPPTRYWAAIDDPNGSKHRKWERDAEALIPLAELVDFVAPSLYVRHTDPDSYDLYARRTIELARTFGKPVLPFVWMQYHQATGRGFEYLPQHYWQTVLDSVSQHADGMIVWGGWDHGWKSDASWWLELKKRL